jgi:hypothetical protein
VNLTGVMLWGRQVSMSKGCPYPGGLVGWLRAGAHAWAWNVCCLEEEENLCVGGVCSPVLPVVRGLMCGWIRESRVYHLLSWGM